MGVRKISLHDSNFLIIYRNALCNSKEINNVFTYSVELGKQLAKAIEPELASAETITTHDSSTNGLIAFAKRYKA